MSAHVADPAVRRPPSRGVAPTGTWGMAATGMAAAGVLHLVAARQHGSSGVLVVGFFLVTAAAQLGAATWLATSRRTAPSPRLLLLALAGTAALLLLYLVAHSSTLLTDHGVVSPGHDIHGGNAAGAAGHAEAPVGPVAMGGEAAAVPDPPTLLGTATVTAELLALAGILALLPGPRRSRAVDVLAVIGATVWLLWFTGVLS